MYEAVGSLIQKIQEQESLNKPPGYRGPGGDKFLQVKICKYLTYYQPSFQDPSSTIESRTMIKETKKY